VAVHTRTVIENIRDILESVGLDLHQLVEVQAFLVDINDFGAYRGSQITRRAEPLVPRKTDRRLKVRTAQIFSGDERFLATTADHQLGDLRSAKWITRMPISPGISSKHSAASTEVLESKSAGQSKRRSDLIDGTCDRR